MPLTREPPILPAQSPSVEPFGADADELTSLIVRIHKGDHSALDMLFRRQASTLVALAARITGSIEDGKDVVQDVFVRLPVIAGNFREPADALAWLRGVTSKTALNSRRKAVRRRESTADALEALRENPSVATALDLSNAVEALPNSLRDVFLLKIVAGYSHREIAELLGIRSGTSEVRLFRAVRQLRTLLAERP